MHLTRRRFLQAAGAAALVVPSLSVPVLAQKGGFTLPKLPYPADALEPHIDAKTMEIHHGRHHQAYVDNLNKALAGAPELMNKSIEDILRDIKKVPEKVRQAVINNGGGHYNHTMFWEIMSPKGGKPSGALAKAIDGFGGMDNLKKVVKEQALARFGSGWAWVVVDKGEKGALTVVSSANQDCLIMYDRYPILGIDVWEHAYYLKYQNRRADYIDAWWNVVNWDAVAARYEKAKK